MKSFANAHVYTAPEVVKTERAAKQVIRGLLDILWDESRASQSKLLKTLVRNVDPEPAAGCSPDYLRCQRLAITSPE